MHLAIIEIDFYIRYPAAGDDAFAANLLDALLDRWHEIAIHILSDQRLGKFHPAVPGLGLNAHPDFRKLPCASGLFFMAIF